MSDDTSTKLASQLPYLNALLEWGYIYIETTIPVLVARSKSKRPLAGPDGSWLTFSEWDPLEKALRQDPNANMGLLLGPEKGSPICAVDIDGQAGLAWARELGVSSREAVWVARTGSGNFHVVYHYPDDVDLSRTVRAEGLPLDLLVNGYILVEPSVTKGPYSWLPGHSPRDIPVSELYPPPKALLDWWCAQSQGGRTGGHRWQDDELEQTLQGVPKGQRDAAGYRLACRYLALGLHPYEVEEFLVAWAARCEPPIGDAPGDGRPEGWARAKVEGAVSAFKRGRLHRGKRRSRRLPDGHIPDIEVGLP